MFASVYNGYKCEYKSRRGEPMCSPYCGSVFLSAIALHTIS